MSTSPDPASPAGAIEASLLPSGDLFQCLAFPPRGVPALFLDRDGVILEDTHFLSDPDGARLCPGIGALLKRVGRAGWAVVIVTNQSGIGRGYYGWTEFAAVQQRMFELLDHAGASGVVHAVLACPHHPSSPDIAYRDDPLGFRKPKPGMILHALHAFGLDPEEATMIGDRDVDIAAAQAAGLSRAIRIGDHGRATLFRHPHAPRLLEGRSLEDSYAEIARLLSVS